MVKSVCSQSLSNIGSKSGHLWKLCDELLHMFSTAISWQNTYETSLICLLGV